MNIEKYGHIYGDLLSEIRDSVSRLLSSSAWSNYEALAIDELEKELTVRCSQKFARCCSSGTIAMELALRGIQVGQGHEVILAGYDYPGNFRSIEAVGARPVLLDIAKDSWSIDADRLDEAYSNQTRAVIVSHLHGSIADMPRICRWANGRGVAVIEDACQSHGAIVHGRPAGGWGDVATISFGGSKLLSAGRGGAVLMQDERIAQRIAVFCERGNDAFPMSPLQACVLLPQWNHLERLHRRRAEAVQAIVNRMTSSISLSPWNHVLLPKGIAEDSDPAYYKLGLRTGVSVEPSSIQSIEGLRNRLVNFLQGSNVASGIGFHGFLRRSSQRCRTIGSLENAHRAALGTVVIHHEELLQGKVDGERIFEMLISWLKDERLG